MYFFLQNRKKIMYSIEDKILDRIKTHGLGWCFSSKDFVALGSQSALDVSLHRLEAKGDVRRIMRGLYDYPEYNNFLKQQLSPDFYQVAQALARKFSWKIQPTGIAALNYFELSTQVPGRITYLTDGPKRSYQILDTTLESMGENRVDETTLAAIRKHLKESEREEILNDTKYVASWIYNFIKKICSEEHIHE
jgi:predicted transcriptional regulator of viral defense system